tara:strand:+ start:213 stop:1391 length:1179 start_codon:yes stop_codon:yes gene_type:complete
MGLTQVSEKGIKDGEILNADINASAAIAGTKIAPDFGSQNVVTTGTLACGDITSSDGNGNLTLKDNNHTGNNTEHKINFTASDNTDLINFISPFGEQHLRLRHGSTELVKFQIDGNVGIGTTSPTHPIDVHTSGTEIARFEGANNARLKLRNSNSNLFLAYTDSGDAFQLGTDGQNPRVHITSGGNVGIGDTNPQSKLAVSAGGSTADPVIMAHVANSNGGFLGFGLYSTINSAYTFKVTNNGRVHAKDGIIFGTDTAADNLLHDYEEGSFTLAASAMSLTAHNENRYVKIGSLVYVTARITFGTTGNGSLVVDLSGLPYTPLLSYAAQANIVAEHTFTNTSGGALSDKVITIQIDGSSGNLRFRDGSDQTELIHNNVSGKTFRFSLTYTTT